MPTATPRHNAVPSTAPAPAHVSSTRSFEQLGVPASVTAVLKAQGITEPFPIQSATLPDSLSGKDLLGRGQTGSGKTLAFGLAVLTRLADGGRRRPMKPRALILVPTRELASQVRSTLEPLASALGLRTTTVYGGVSQSPQASAIRSGVDVLIACPGRLEDLIEQRLCDLSSVEITILDEADQMADLGFLPAVRRLLDATPRNGQRLLFSATLDGAIDTLVRKYLRDPAIHSIAPVVSNVSTMTHHLFTVEHAEKPAVIRDLASGEGRSLLFTRTKHMAGRLAKQLTAAGVPAVDLHGNLSQRVRDRNLAAFSSGQVRVLVATDIAARGIHVDNIGLVVHVDPPAEAKAFLHRSGRTARAGADGIVVTLQTPQQRREVRLLTRQAGIDPQTAVVRPGAREITAITGPAVEPVFRATAVPAEPASQSPRGRRPARNAGPSGRTGQPGRGGQAARGNHQGSNRRPGSDRRPAQDRVVSWQSDSRSGSGPIDEVKPGGPARGRRGNRVAPRRSSNG